MSELAQVLRHLLPVDDPAALVDASTGDDAAVYRIDEERALVVTVDFFTPIVDDPFEFGRIGAANALSDVYAMGGRPLFGLNLVGFPRRLLGEGLLEEIVRGGSEGCREAGIPVLGGHSVDDAEPKFGMVVVGEVHPDRLLTNRGARPGDRLVLTKALGTGVVSTAIKAGAAPAAVVEAAITQMAQLNRAAAEALAGLEVHAATDVTGYGLLGHLRNLVRDSKVDAELEASAVPILSGVRELARGGHVPGGSKRNRVDLEDVVRFDDAIDEVTRILLCDAQTSGGLLVALPEADASTYTERVPGARVVGSIGDSEPGTIRVR